MSKKNKTRLAIAVTLLGIAAILGVVAFNTISVKEPAIVFTEPSTAPEPTETPITPAPTLVPKTPEPSPETVITEEPIDKTPKPEKKHKEDPSKEFYLVVGDSQIGIAYGVEESALDKTPGWLETSAYPGEEGVCVIYGHRNRNHLRVLKNVEIGDTIVLRTANGNFDYIVESIEILDNSEALTIPTLDGKRLMISTCYPFHYSGKAPQKYVLVARQL